MHKGTYVIGVDIGTTSTKAIVFSRSGSVMAKHAIDYPLHTPVPGAAVQDPEQIFEAVVAAVKSSVEQANIAREEILCMSFSSAMHSVIAMDEHGSPLTPCMTWADTRSHGATREIEELNGIHVYRRTGTPIHPMAPLSKLRWLRDAHPDVFAAAKKFISIKEYVFFKLFGEYVIDYSIASATGLFNILRLDWDEEALELAGVTREQLAEPRPTTAWLTNMRQEFATAMGISTGLPCVLGAGDGVLANLGVYAMEPGVAAATIGTSGAVRGVTSKPATDEFGRTFCYALTENHWVIGGAINSGGIVMQWVRDQLATHESKAAIALGQDPYNALSDLAATAPAGSDGLLLLPFLMGERAPYWNADARGVYFGLAMHHEKRHLVRAAFEGVIYQMYAVTKVLEELSRPFEEIRATGGFTQSPLWRQIMADVFGNTVTVPQVYESSCFGAALLGFLAMGQMTDLSEAKDLIQIRCQHTPNIEQHALYSELTSLYEKLYRDLETEFTTIARIQERLAKPQA